MKKILLMTWLGKGNFGTCLQSYSLNRVLKMMGYDVSILSGLPSNYSIKWYAKYLIGILHLTKLMELIRHPYQVIQIGKRTRFQSENYKEVKVFGKKEEGKLEENFDCFLAGSDQIWNTFFNFYNRKFFFPFIKKSKKIAYASSIGTNSIKEECKDDVRGLLMKFSHIGVRETEAVKVLSELTGRTDIKQVLDPTFLLTPQDWQQMSSKAVYETDMPNNYIFCYFIGNNSWYIEQLKDVCKKNKIENIIIVPATENQRVDFDGSLIYKNASPVEFVDLIRKASLVCTDSFHATALSINLSVPFVEFMRFKDNDAESQNSRIYDLLCHYGLENRIYDRNTQMWAESINYQPVQGILNNDRIHSMDYLKNAIEY